MERQSRKTKAESTPTKHAKAVVPNRTPKKAAFLAAFAETGIVKAAAETAGISPKHTYYWLRNDQKFAEAFQQAKESAIEKLESEARRRAEDGVARLKFHNGRLIMIPDPAGRTERVKVPAKRCRSNGRWVTEPEHWEPVPVMVPYVEHEYSDTLLIFLLKALRPEKYRDNHLVTSSNETGRFSELGGRLPAIEKLVEDCRSLISDLAPG
jgi:hypothetical protein